MNIVIKAASKASKTGTPYAFAKRLGVTPQAVNQWKDKGYIPAKRIQEVSNLTGIELSVLLAAIPQG